MRLWPPVGVLAMLALGLLVGKGSTDIDDWFLHDLRLHGHRMLLIFIDWRLLLAIWIGCAGYAVWRRRWRLAAVVVASPVIAISCVKLIKPLFGRTKGGTLAYPSGHTTLLVVLLGLVVIAAGWRLGVVLAAAVVVLLGMLGLAMTYHYFTDTVGALLFGSAVVCVSALVADDRQTTAVRSPSRH